MGQPKLSLRLRGRRDGVVSLTRFWCWNSPPAPTSRTPFLPQPQVLPLQNLANPTPVPAALRRSLTLARDKEKQDPEGHGSQPLAKSVQLHRGLTGLFCTIDGHAAFHQEAAQGRIQPSTIECLAQAWTLYWEGSRRGKTGLAGKQDRTGKGQWQVGASTATSPLSSWASSAGTLRLLQPLRNTKNPLHKPVLSVLIVTGPTSVFRGGERGSNNL